MKTILTGLMLATSAMVLPAQIVTTNTYNGSSLLIPDGNPVGIMQQFMVSDLFGVVANVQVQLDITGGFNGDLYAYLVNPQGEMAVLLNRPGVTADNAFGYSDSGMKVTLDGWSAINIHFYGTVPNYSLDGTTWTADGRNIDPQSSGSLFDSAATSANLGIYQNTDATDANGVWTFFLADLSSGGGVANLNNVTVTIMTVPEPQTWVVMLGGGLSLFWLARKCR